MGKKLLKRKRSLLLFQLQCEDEVAYKFTLPNMYLNHCTWYIIQWLKVLKPSNYMDHSPS